MIDFYRDIVPFCDLTQKNSIEAQSLDQEFCVRGFASARELKPSFVTIVDKGHP
jgi:hypothetical protein